MAVRVTHVRFSGQEKTHQTIVRYAWTNTATGSTGDNDKPSMVSFADSKKNKVVVGTGTNEVQVGAVHPEGGPLRGGLGRAAPARPGRQRQRAGDGPGLRTRMNNNEIE